MELQGKVINFLGDSITYGGGASCGENGYVSLLAERAKLSKANNYGLGGTRIARQIKPTNTDQDKDFLLRCENMDVQADMIVVFGGTNDFGHGDAPIGVISDITEYSFYGACKLLFGRLKCLYPKSKICVITPMHRKDEENPYGEGKGCKGEKLSVYVAALKEVAQEFKLPVLDLFCDDELDATDDRKNEKYFADGLHPNDCGHSLLANKIIDFLKAL